MKKTKLISLVVILMLALSMFLYACGGTDEIIDDGGNIDVAADETVDGNGTDEPAAEINPRDIPDNLPEGNFDGADFRILFRNSCIRGNWAVVEPHRMYIYSEMMTGDIINDAVFQRNLEVMERFNVNIVGLGYPFGGGANEAGLRDYARRTIQANSDEFDMVVSWSTHLATLAAEGLFVDWNSIPYINTNQPWWMQSAMDELTIFGRTFLAKSDLIFPGVVNDAQLILFNQTLIENFDIESPYVMVEENRWTLEVFDTLVRQVGFVDVNGTGIRDYNAIYGFASDSWGSGFAWLWAGGGRVTSRDADGLPYYDMMTERNAVLLQRVFDLFFNNEGSAIYANQSTIRFRPGGDQAALFADGNAVFLSDRVGQLLLPEFRAAEFDFGIVPMPKFDQYQERFLTMVNEHASIMGIPAFNSNLEMTGKVVEALSAASHRLLVPAYYEVGLQTRYSRDEESVRMLDLIVDGIVFDFGLLYHIPTWNIYQTILSSRTDPGTFASSIEREGRIAERRIEQILNMYAEID